jgi:ribosomal protein S24E
LQIVKRTESKVLGRSYLEVSLDESAGKISRKDAVEAVAKELGVPNENVGLIRMDGGSGTRDVVGRFYVYTSMDMKARLQPRHLSERALTKEEREKLKQERKKQAAPPAAAEAKK